VIWLLMANGNSKRKLEVEHLEKFSKPYIFKPMMKLRLSSNLLKLSFHSYTTKQNCIKSTMELLGFLKYTTLERAEITMYLLLICWVRVWKISLNIVDGNSLLRRYWWLLFRCYKELNSCIKTDFFIEI